MSPGRGALAALAVLSVVACAPQAPVDEPLAGPGAASTACGPASAGAASAAVADTQGEVQRSTVTAANDYPAGTTDQLLRQFDAVAVVVVADRQRPVAQQRTERAVLAAQPPASRAAPATDVQVVRPARLAVERQLKGRLPACLPLDVPGGIADGWQEANDAFPPALPVGARALGLFVGTGGSAAAQTLLLADGEGVVTLPFAEQRRVDLDTWELSAEAAAPPEQPSETGQRPVPAR